MLHQALKATPEADAILAVEGADDVVVPPEGRESVGGVRVKRDLGINLAVPLPGEGGGRTNRPLVVVNSDGVYLFMLRVSTLHNASFVATVDIDMISSYGYLSASGQAQLTHEHLLSACIY